MSFVERRLGDFAPPATERRSPLPGAEIHKALEVPEFIRHWISSGAEIRRIADGTGCAGQRTQYRRPNQ
jgi:hypothetical protein